MADPILESAKNKTDPTTVNPKLAALGLARELMNSKNPTVAIINAEFCLGHALMTAIQDFYVVDETHENNGLAGVIGVFSEFEEHSASIDGTGRQQVVECVVNSSRNYYQGISPLEEQKGPSAFSRLVGMFTGNRGGPQQ